ncbi:hypothetical protein SAMN06265222_101673 [Neorhodopirellula lusitana]|uniref:DUF4190 domain-containing protein n=1 Tax=Neorhodopirellula lusitana TaxID=445327 RepID=A0ABY1PUB7_9BACT|nr:DUF4190 domain-containing protein [Neorhodopirellula lusitana]SMP41902.1 hypothetical protein SAMN06265222_101673 [Neorhodopirellula lusitana]
MTDSSNPDLDPAAGRPQDTGSPSKEGGSLGSLHAAGIPRMGAEDGYQLVDEEDVPPLRASGIVCFILGLLSFWATVAWQMLILPIVAIIFGIIAMRKWGKVRPAGTTAAVLGLVLASAFGAAGIVIPTMKQRTLGKQAEYFAREFLEVVGDGEVELALELQKQARNRQLGTMDLKKAYANDKVASEQREDATEGMVSTIGALGPDIEWELAEPVRVFFKYGIEKADTYWIDPSNKESRKIQILLEWHPNETDKTGQWNVSLFQYHRELIVAPTVL